MAKSCYIHKMRFTEDIHFILLQTEILLDLTCRTQPCICADSNHLLTKIDVNDATAKVLCD